MFPWHENGVAISVIFFDVLCNSDQNRHEKWRLFDHRKAWHSRNSFWEILGQESLVLWTVVPFALASKREFRCSLDASIMMLCFLRTRKMHSWVRCIPFVLRCSFDRAVKYVFDRYSALQALDFEENFSRIFRLNVA